MQERAVDGFEVLPWTPHDLRRVIRTHMSRLRVRREIAERVMAHRLGGVEAIYDRYEYLEEKREALALWEAEIIRIAIEEGVADRLGVHTAKQACLGQSLPVFSQKLTPTRVVLQWNVASFAL
jgi:hypothetical protein